MHRRIQVAVLLGCVVAAYSGCSATQTSTRTVTIGTFNIEWLGDGIEPEQKPRAEEDYAAIAQLIAQSNADVLAVQKSKTIARCGGFCAICLDGVACSVMEDIGRTLACSTAPPSNAHRWVITIHLQSIQNAIERGL